MTPQEITEGNKLIAEFDGYKFYNDAQGDFPNGYYCLKDNSLPMFPEDFCYHENWSWLMPVVEKIEKNGCIVEIWMSLGKGCRIQKVLTKIKNWQTVRESNSTIEAVWLAVIEFIKWHNQQK